MTSLKKIGNYLLEALETKHPKCHVPRSLVSTGDIHDDSMLTIIFYKKRSHE